MLKINFDKIKNKSIDLDLFIHIFAFISVLLIGADKWGFDIGVNIRLDQFFLLIFSLLVFIKINSIFYFDKSLLCFLLFSIFSVFFAFNKFRSVVFFASFIYNAIFVYLSFFNYVKIYGIQKFINIFRTTCYVQFFIFFLQYVLKVIFKYELPFLPAYGEYMGVPRFSLWFYEPSYLATYLIFWFAFSTTMLTLNKDLSYFKDFCLCIIILILSTSTSGFLGIALTLFLVYVIWLCKKVTLKKLSLLIIPIILFFILKLFFNKIYTVFILRLFNNNLDAASGGRIQGWFETIEVFKENILFGVGPGNYGLYLGKGSDAVPSNITLELLATTGIIASFFFIIFNAKMIIKSIKKRNDNIISYALGLSLLIFLIILQINQGYLRLYHWMFLAIINGQLYNFQNKQFNNMINSGSPT